MSNPTVAEFFQSLDRRGVTIRLGEDKLVATPAGTLTDADKAWLRDNKPAVVAWLSWPGDDVADAVAARAWDDDPFADHASPVRLRESVIVRLPDCPVVAMSPEGYEGIVAWNKAVRERHARAAAITDTAVKPGRGKPHSRRGIFAADVTREELDR